MVPVSINVNIFKLFIFPLEILLKYPSFPIQLKKVGTQTKVFDPVRKNWYLLSPEEWVRQHILNFLIEHKKFPSSNISVEKSLILNGQLKRYDIVVYKQMQPFLVVECKAPFVNLKESTVEQALRYNLILNAEYVMISNGIRDFIFKGKVKQSQLPEFT